MDTPTKEQFQELIDFCKRDYLSNDLEIIKNISAKDLRKILYDFALTRDESLKEMKSLAAFYWLDEGNRDNQYNFNKALAVFPLTTINNIDNWADESALLIACYVKDRLKYIAEAKEYLEDGITIDESFTDELMVSLQNSAVKMTYSLLEEAREYESMVGYITYCLMEYIYPNNRYKNSIKPQIVKIISTLEKLQALESDLHNYEEFSYLPEIAKICRSLEGRIEVYKKVLDGGHLPFEKKSNHSHYKRMFIINVRGNFPDLIKYKGDAEDMNACFLKFIVFLMDIDCFDNPMTEGSINNILKSEHSRFINRINMLQLEIAKMDKSTV